MYGHAPGKSQQLVYRNFYLAIPFFTPRRKCPWGANALFLINCVRIVLLKILKNLGRCFNRIEELFISFLLLAMIFLSSLQIFMRTLFDSGLIWADPLLRYLVLWVGLLGAVLATRYGKHITIDIFSHLLPARGVCWLNLLLNLFASVVCGFLTWAAFLFIKNEIAFGGGRELVGIPVWGWNLIFPFAFALMAVRFLVKVYESGVTLLQLKSSSSRSISGSA